MSHAGQAIHPTLREAVELLERHKLRWALLRPPTSLDRPRGDVDLLVHPDDLDDARRHLGGLGFTDIAPSGESRPVLAYDSDTRSWLHLDLTSRVVPRGLDPVGAITVACLGRVRHDGAVPRLHEEDEFWALVVHLLHRRDGIEPRHRAALAVGAAAASLASPIPRGIVARRPRARSALDAVRASIRSNDDEAVAETMRALRTLVGTREGRWLSPELLRKPLSAWRHRGVSVALLGPDGAGKSTLAECLASRSFFPTKIIYMGTGAPGDVATRPRPLRWFRSPVLFSVAGTLTQWIRYLDGLLERVRGRLVVFDRYTEEALLPARASDSTFRRLARAVRRWTVCPAPELTVILDAPGQVMFARKGEHDTLALEEDRRRYRSLLSRLSNSMTIDAQRPPEEVCDVALLGVWVSYQRRLGTAEPSRRRARGGIKA